MLTWERQFSPVEGPYEGIDWVTRHPRIWQPNEETGENEIVFQQKDVRFPDFYGETSVKIITQKYFRGYVNKETGEAGPDRESSLRELVDRVMDTIAGWAGFEMKVKPNEFNMAPWKGWTMLMKPNEGSAADYEFLRHAGNVDGLDINYLDEAGCVTVMFYKRPRGTMAKTTEVYFDSLKSWEAWRDDLKWLMLHQYYWFNSPVQFNVGIDEHPQCHACFILDVNDWILSDKELRGALDEDIRFRQTPVPGHPEDFDLNDHGLLAWQIKEGIIFSRGSGSGVNLSKIRSDKEFLSSGGKPTGPLSFARGCDTWASQIKSGGKTRRAAKMLEMDIDHPDIDEFIRVKSDEEGIARALGRAGYGKKMDSESYQHAFHQNSNLSVRVSDAFMEAVDQRGPFQLISRSNHFLEARPKATSMIGVEGRVIGERNAYEMMQGIAQHCWECGDPGIQFHDTMNAWNPVRNDDLIFGTNPCSEYVYLNETACNLGSHNLVKYLAKKIVDSNTGAWQYVFDMVKFIAATRAFFVAHDVIVSNSKYPTKNVAEMSNKHRTVGMGFCNLGGMLMLLQLPYDSQDARTIAGSIASLMTAECYRTSCGLADQLGAFEPMERNRQPVLDVMEKHLSAHESLRTLTYPGWYAVQQAGQQAWMWVTDHIGTGGSIRNGQASLIAPTGTIGIAMDADTTGLEPEFALVRFKQLAGGGVEKMMNHLVVEVMANLGYSEEEIHELDELMMRDDRPSIRTWTGWHQANHIELFRTSVSPPEDQKFCLPWQSHVEMMAAVQSSISGAISKTINMPKDATVEDVFGAYLMSWTLGLKCIAVYRDQSKMTQAIATGADKEEEASSEIVEGLRNQVEALMKSGVRRTPPNPLPALRNKFRIGKHKGYLHVGFYPDTWEVAEIFIELSKTGSTLNGFVDTVCILFSVAVQHGVPLESLVKQFETMNFEPSGPVDHDIHIKRCWSIPDYIVRKVKILEEIAKKRKGLPTPQPLSSSMGEAEIEILDKETNRVEVLDRLCPVCGSLDVQIVGSCLQCLTCTHEEGTCYS